jgi:hypothetical protein
VLIDTFVYPGFIEEDRTYGNLWEGLTKVEKEMTYFVPTLYGFEKQQIYDCFQKLRVSKRNFLLKEDFLRVSDYFYAVAHFFRVRLIKLPTIIWVGIDLSRLVKEELRFSPGGGSAVLALLNFRFAKRLKQAGVKVKRVINRFENQVIDKGWNSGFQQHFTNTDIIGYQGFVASPLYLCMYPTETERIAGVLPSKLAVIGKGFISSRKEFCLNIKCIVAPAIRFSKVWEKQKNQRDVDYFTLLVALPFSLSGSIYTIRLIIESLDGFSDSGKKIRIWIKPHPTIKPDVIRMSCGAIWSVLFTFVEGSFNDYIERADLFLGNSSSTCLETLAKGIPVIIVGNQHGFTQNPIPKVIDKGIWMLCRTPEELTNAIKNYSKCSQQMIERYKGIGEKIRQEFFEQPTPQHIRKFLYG